MECYKKKPAYNTCMMQANGALVCNYAYTDGVNHILQDKPKK